MRQIVLQQTRRPSRFADRSTGWTVTQIVTRDIGEDPGTDTLEVGIAQSVEHKEAIPQYRFSLTRRTLETADETTSLGLVGWC